ncbi:SDR family NAD(P)-dependent oxidoreductase [Streptomyces turgidiscabies]|uniref:Phthiocerol/phenolphthiocerol synthesis type-I polyketide synthase D n=1 Tax=Streptomyces turgidiscabies TaxID=85558 RepID=A0ABU0RMN2_9ACTN|nr:SDR family NAD(P)-dependent oxidoreductase [Streptomyces turgidiscabies]MDQ0933252.1 phthiocerol/phenolphthiocerol synthesis type-I polyketide synthase D [Streptomyces turgidiscabies]
MTTAQGGDAESQPPSTEHAPAPGAAGIEAPTAAEIRSMLRHLVADLCGVPADELDAQRPLTEYGLTSRDAVGLSGRLEELLDRTLPATLVWENPSIEQLVRSLASGEPREQSTRTRTAAKGADRTGADAVAVVGIGCRLPGDINGPDAFWEGLLAGTNAVGQVPDERWQFFDDGASETTAALARTTRWGAFLADIEGFDADFFGITPDEADVMDPQQRLLLEVGCEALDHAGIPLSALQGSATGVFVGLSALEYGHLTTADLPGVTPWTSTGAAGSIAANRMSYLLDLRGPSMTIDTACSSSLVAVHQACRSLRDGECDTALAAGVNVLLSPAITANFDQVGALAPDGRCKPFDARADGIVRGEGCGVVVLKRLTDAQRDGDRVLAVIRGTAVNSDGRSAGLMAPNPVAQEALLRSALRDAGTEASDIGYIEAHGTGTLLGDPIEAGALGAVLGRGRPADQPLLIGSVKSNLGHLEGAAGIVGLIKTVLSLHHGKLPASLHFQSPNPHIDFAELGLRVVAEPTRWPAERGRPALAGVSAFGFGGTNAHAVLQQAPQPASPRAEETAEGVPHILVVTARSQDRLGDVATGLARWLNAQGRAVPLADVCHTLAHQRRGPAGAAVVGRGRRDLTAALAALAKGETPTCVVPPRTAQDSEADRKSPRRPVLVFSGYGSQWNGMGRGLLRDDPVFAAAVREQDPVFEAETGSSLTDLISRADQGTSVDRTQPLLFGLQLALADTLRAYGVEPAAVIGHSMGEVSAAVVAGALDTRDGLRVILNRSTRLAAIDVEQAGAMAAVELPEDTRADVLGRHPDVGVAVYASPRRCTVTGPSEPIARMVEEVEAQGRLARLLAVGGAGHSAAVDPVLPALRDALDGLSPRTATIPWYGTVLDDARADIHADAHYWCANVRRPVRFQQAVAAAAADGHDIFLEVSPHPIAVVPVTETLDAVAPGRGRVLSTVHRDSDESVRLRTALAELHLAGVRGLAGQLWPDGKRAAVPSPPWRHVPHWFRRGKTSRRPVPAGGHGLLGTRVEDPGTDRVLWHGDIGTDGWNQQPAKLHGRAVLSLPVCAELVITAATAASARAVETVHIENLAVHHWLPVSARTPVTTVWEPKGRDQATVGIHSRSSSGAWLCHASARVLTRPEPLARREPGGAASFESGFAVPGAAEDASNQRPHGKLLHAVLHAPAGRDRPGGEVPRADQAPSATEDVPVSVRSLQVRLQAPARGECRVRCLPRVDESTTGDARGRSPHRGRWDIHAEGPGGRELVVAHDTQFRSVEPGEIPRPLDETTYEITWEKAPLSLSSPPARVLLLTDQSGGGVNPWAASLASALREQGVEVALADHQTDSLGSLLDTWREGTRDGRAAVVMLLAAGTEPPGTCRGLHAAADVARRLASDERQLSLPRLWLVTERAQTVVPGETGNPDLAALRGLVRVLALERPVLRTTLVDIDPQPALVDDLAQELLADGEADEVAWRGGTRFIARLAAVAPDDACARVPFARSDGAYIVTGGLTGLGLATARRLAQQGAGRIVLNGRSSPGRATQAVLTELGEHGTSLVVVQGDVAQPGVATRLVEAALSKGHSLCGVAHAAAVLHDRVITDLHSSDIEAVFRPKVTGALQLEAATAGHDLDWWLAYSSAAALFGSPGQAAYAAANAWLDAHAHRRRAGGLPATAIAWGPWADVGAAPENPAVALESITSAEGLDALQALVTRGRTYTGVVHLDARRALEAFPGLDAVAFFAGVLRGSGLPDDDWDGPGNISTLGEAAPARIYERLVRRTAAVMGRAVQDLAENVPLIDFGLDSLMTVRIQNAVKQDFAVVLPGPLLLRGASLRAVGDAVLRELGLAGADTGDTAAASQPKGVEQERVGSEAVPALPTTLDPRDAAERLVAGVWHEVLGRRPEGVNQDFLAAGGDQHTAHDLVEGIRRRLGETAPALTEEQVLDHSTVATLAELIRPAVNETGGSVLRVLRDIRPGIHRPALFTFHPAGGPTSVYRPLVQLLPAEQPVYGFERVDRLHTMEEKAAHYLGLIRELQPQGPYHLLGWSFGGCLAYEVARQLRETDQAVGFLGLIDTILPAALPGLDSKELLLERFGRFAEYIEKTYGRRLDLPYEELAATPDEQQIDVVMRLVAEAGLSMSPGVMEHQRTSYVDARVGERYRPQPCPDPVVLYRAQEAQRLTTSLDPRYLRSEPDLGWAPLCPSLEVVPVQGDHLSLIDPPHVEVLAQHLTKALQGQGDE